MRRPWSLRMYERLLAVDGRRLDPAVDWGDALEALSVAFPDRDRAMAALDTLETGVSTPRRRRRSPQPRRFWTEAEDRRLRELYPTRPTAEVAELLERTVPAVYARADGLGVKKDARYLQECWRQCGEQLRDSGRAHRFQKGNVPWTKGKKGLDVGGRSHETCFKKGQTPHTWMPVGSERWIPGSNGKAYLYRKVADRRGVPWTVNWRLVHHLHWERYRGPVPKGSILVFKNGDRSDIRVANLEVITRAENARRNVMWNRYPYELAHAIRLRGALRRRIRRLERGH